MGQNTSKREGIHLRFIDLGAPLVVETMKRRTSVFAGLRQKLTGRFSTQQRFIWAGGRGLTRLRARRFGNRAM